MDTQTVEAVVEKVHERFGGSKAAEWVNCSGSVFFREQMPPQEAGESARKGTLAHALLLDMALPAFLEHKAEGTPADRYDETIRTSAEDAAMVDHTFTAVEVVWEKVFQQSITGKVYGLEEKFFFDEALSAGGTLDLWGCYLDDRGNRVGIIFDYKYGVIPVDADKNAQLAFYACALQRWMTEGGKPLDYVRGIIYQPRRPHGEAYQETKFTKKQLATWDQKFTDAIKLVVVDQKPVYKTGDHCRFCVAKAVCPKQAKNVEKESALALLQENPITVLPKVEQIPDDQLARIVLNYDLVVDFMNACYEYAKTRAQQGTAIPGTKLVEGTSKRKWLDDTELIAQSLRNHGISEPLTYEPKLIGIVDAERALSKRLGGKEAAKAALESLCTKTTPPVTVVPESDPRPAIQAASDLLAALPAPTA